MLTGLLEPTRGVVLFGGHNIRDDLAGYRKRLGYVPEEPNLYPYLTGWEYLELLGTLRGMLQPSLEKKIDSLLELFSLHPHRHSTIRILLKRDAPTHSSHRRRSNLQESCSGLGQQGELVFYCSHVLEVVEKVCSDVLILRQGKVIAQDSVENIRKILGQSLEHSFLHLVEDIDTISIARDTVAVMSAA